MSIRILLAEDDKNFGRVLRDYLALHTFRVTLCEDGEAALSVFENGQFDLCIFDIMMPKKDGFSLAAAARKIKHDIPFIFLTALGQKDDVLKGFRLGADDFITKPFDSEVLLLKIQAIMNRYGHATSPALTEYPIGASRFNTKLRSIKTGDEETRLSPKESALLQLLCEHMNDVLPRAKALKQIWADDNYFTARSMDVYVAKLRKYLQHDGSVSIDNIHGSGYSLRVTPVN